MSWVDSLLLVVPGGVSSQLKDLSCKVLHDSSKVDGCSGSYTLRVVTLTEKTVNTSHRELKPSTG